MKYTSDYLVLWPGSKAKRGAPPSAQGLRALGPQAGVAVGPQGGP